MIILRDLVTSGLPPAARQSLRQPPPKHTLPGWGRCGLLGPFLAFDNAAAGRSLRLVDSRGFTPFWHRRGRGYGSNWFREFSKKEAFGNSEQRSFSHSFTVLGLFCFCFSDSTVGYFEKLPVEKLCISSGAPSRAGRSLPRDSSPNS